MSWKRSWVLYAGVSQPPAKQSRPADKIVNNDINFTTLMT
jgi:hypothetical protein